MKRSEHISPTSEEKLLSGVKLLTYNTIEDLPVWNWNKIIETGDLKYLFKKHESQQSSEVLFPIWDDLQQQYFDEFGQSQELINRERIMFQLVKLNLKYLKTKDRSVLNFIKIKKHQLDELNKQEGIKFGKLLIYVSKYMGFRVDPKNISVYEWNHTLKLMEQDVRSKGKSDNRR